MNGPLVLPLPTRHAPTTASTLLGESTTGSVAAWVHLEIAEATALRLNGLRDARLQVGSEARVAAQPIDAAGRALGGGLNYEWFSSDPEILEVVAGEAFDPGSEHDDEAVLRALQPGTATVRIEAADVMLEFELVVEGSATAGDE